ncbi:DUF84 family protein [Bhargavaea beijingensis]|uniref:inosine/xanthosine triphosphatase n=1 Tax=Bhargavaea beijingensis TaxID=426756 RepID=A0A1G7ELQ7_9BACL|nr:DUF84 family protein [Bhargavaea beijingensis]RSK25339.1 DUF84 family protein [Bhargavaea beijingensis]SDE64335.1 inosine/xanthosine triphosphatase [Bhargavaea beijingensis]
MKIVVGSSNLAKIGAVKNAFESLGIQADVTGAGTESGVAAQPFGDEETLTGARNRAIAALKTGPHDLSIGLEGGVKELDGRLYICNWGALALPDRTVFTAGGAQIPLPDEVAVLVRGGKELGPVMEALTSKEDIRQTGGAVGVFTDGTVSRSAMFSQIVLLLAGQWRFASGQRGRRQGQ